MAYISSRKIVVIKDDEELNAANESNRLSALRAALLLLPSSFSEQDLFVTITGLSYMGMFSRSIWLDD